MADDERLATGMRIVEIGPSIAAAVAGMVLADHGAEVITLERPGGSRLRAQPAHRMWSRGKRCVQLDLTEPAGQTALRQLVTHADVVIVGLRPTTAEQLGVDGPTLGSLSPQLVHCSITGFGPQHPLADLPGYDHLVASRGGRAYEFAILHKGERPSFPAVPVATHGASMLALQGIFAALREREHTGRGQLLETSLLRALTVYDLASWTPDHPMALRLDDVPSPTYPVCRTADGVWLQFAQNSPTLYRAFLRCLDLLEVYDDPRFTGAPWVADPDDARALRTILLERVAERSWGEWQKRFADEADISAEPFLAPGEVLDHHQAVATGDRLVVDDPALGPSQQLGPLAEYRGCALGTAGVAPTVESPDRAEWSAPARPVTTTGVEETTPPLLTGITVLELATWIATPLATSLLRELGARVIKIEPLSGDPFRGHGRTGWKCVQGKESIAVDLKTPEGREIVHRLATRADGLAHNFRPGVPERLGIDPATLLQLNPRLVHVYAGSYGSTGPMADRPAFHVTFGAINGGVLAQIGADGAPDPDAHLSAEQTAHWAQQLTRANEPNPDFNAALATAAAMTMGLWHRDRTGAGQSIETRMLAANAYAMSEHGVQYVGREPITLPDAERLGISARYRLYPAAAGWVFLATPTDAQLDQLGHLVDHDDLAELSDDELAARLVTVFATATADEWEARAAAAGVGCVRADVGPLARYLYGETWAVEQGLVVESTPNGVGPYRRYGPAVTGARSVGPMGAADAAGAQTRDLLVELGYGADDIDQLIADGIVGLPH